VWHGWQADAERDAQLKAEAMAKAEAEMAEMARLEVGEWHIS